MFSKVSAPFYIPTSKAQGFCFLHFLVPLVIVHLFYCVRLVGVKWCLEIFDLHFPNDWGYWTSFHLLIGHLYLIFGEMSIQIFGPLCNWIICLFIIELWQFFVYSGWKSLFGYMTYKYFPSVCGLSFHHLDGVFCSIEVLNFDVVQLIYFFFCHLSFWCHI